MISPIPKKMQSNSKILSVLIALNTPKENISANSNSWSEEFLRDFCKEYLQWPQDAYESYVDAYLPIILSSSSESTEESQRAILHQMFSVCCNEDNCSAENFVVGILSDVIVFLLTKKKYDARGRSLSRNLYKALRTGLNEYFLADEFDAISMKSLHPITANTMDKYNWIRTFEALENTLIATISRLLNQPTAVEISSSSTTKSSRFNPLNTVSSLYARVRPTNPNPSPNLNPLGNTKNDSKQKEKSQTSKMIRFAKIGAVGLGVGAVLAVTGGLAAPAICGALLVMGTTGAGAIISVSTMATLFGTAGAGLAGYKMMKRTRGLQEFQFEYCPDGVFQAEKGKDSNERKEQSDSAEKNWKVSVAIAISGWMEEDQDYRRSFGVLPDNQHISTEERLVRFYSVHSPDRLERVPLELQTFNENPEDLFSQLTCLLDVDPMGDRNLVPPILKPSSHIDLFIKNEMANLQKLNQSVSSAGDDDDEEMKVDGETIERLVATALSNSSKIVPAPAQPSDAATAESSTIGQNEILSAAAVDGGPNHTVDIENLGSTEGFGYESFYKSDDIAEYIPEAENDFSELPQQPISLRDVNWHWRELCGGNFCAAHDLYLLRWETRLQKELGGSILAMLKSLRSAVIQNLIASTLLASLASAVMLPAALLQLTNVIDNLWSIAVERADEAGVELARALVLRLEEGTDARPVTLIGYSVGARVVVSCLKELARIVQQKQTELGMSNLAFSTSTRGADKGGTGVEVDSLRTSEDENEEEKLKSRSSDEQNLKPTWNLKEKEQFERKIDQSLVEKIKVMIQDVIILGTPFNAECADWRRMRSVVSGRFVNGYSQNDMVLSVLYRLNRMRKNVAGISPVDIHGVENIDLSNIVTQHTDYCKKMKLILEIINAS